MENIREKLISTGKRRGEREKEKEREKKEREREEKKKERVFGMGGKKCACI